MDYKNIFKINVSLINVFLLLLLFVSRGITQNTELLNQSSQMQEGEWIEFETNGLDLDLLSSNGDWHNILEYTDKAVWYPRTREIFFVGGGHNAGMEFINYNADNNAWKQMPDPYWMPGIFICHSYHCNAIDPINGLFFFIQCNSNSVHQYDISSGQWSDLPREDNNFQAFAMSLEYFPEMSSLIQVINKYVYRYNFNSKSWSTISDNVEMGPYHNFVEYNPVYKFAMLGGGNGSNKVHSLDADGNISPLQDSPFSIYMSGAVITCDPVSGEYLALGGGKEFYSFNPDQNNWTKLPDPPSGIFTLVSIESNIFGTVVIPIPDYGIIMFVKYNASEGGDVYLYKHKKSNGVKVVSIPQNLRIRK